MNLLELARFYQIMLKMGGRQVANDELRELGVDDNVSVQLSLCSNDQGQSVHSIPRYDGVGGFSFIFEDKSDYVYEG